MVRRRGSRSVEVSRNRAGQRRRPGLEIVFPVLGNPIATDGGSPELVNEDLEQFLASFGREMKRRHGVDSESPFEINVEPDTNAEDFTPLSTYLNHGKQSMRRPIQIYDPDERMGLTVVERRLPMGYSHQSHLYWSPNDIGQIKSEVRNEFGRLRHPYPQETLSVTFRDVVRVSDIDSGSSNRELALLPDAASPEAELLCRAHEVSLRAFSRRLSRYQFPDAAYTPAMEFCNVRGEQAEPVVQAAIEIGRDLLPITVELGRMEFTADQRSTV